MITTYEVEFSSFAQMYQVWGYTPGSQRFCFDQFKTEHEANQYREMLEEQDSGNTAD